MKTAVALSALACLIAQSALAGDRSKRSHKPTMPLVVNSLPQNFDLAHYKSEDDVALDRETASPGDPQMPNGIDLRLIAWDPPGFEVALNQSGAVLAIGAMGTRHKGMPKLAHVGIDWDF